MYVIQSVVDEHSAASAEVGIFRHQRRVGVLLVKIFVDDAGLEKNLPGVVDHRYFAVGI
jgi:hypothetical protein